MPYKNIEDKIAYRKRTQTAQQRSYRNRNREKVRAFPCNSNATHKKSHRAGNLRRTYGITLADYDRMLLEQEGKCAICLTDKPTGKGNIFHVDHDHKTGIVRALLCHNCNLALGHSQEDPIIIKRMLDYVIKFQKEKENCNEHYDPGVAN